jgi:carbamoyl-phosphate synthase large subunit
LFSLEQFRNRRILVTGGAGVIGRELLRQIAGTGAQILSIDREPLPAQERAPAIVHVQRDLAECDSRDIREFQPEIVFHLAASFERTEESPEFWPVNWNDNLLASHNVIEASAASRALTTFVFASSYLIYDTRQYISQTAPDQPRILHETDRVSTRNLCGGAKYYTEQELRFLNSVARPELLAPCARIFRVYGRGSRDVVSRWIRAAMTGADIEVYNPQNRFDYIFAADVAEGLLRISVAPQIDGPVNLGSGRSRGINEVLDILSSRFSHLAESMRSLGSPGPFEASCAGLDRLRSLTGWSPPTALEEGVDRIIEYEEKLHGASAVTA